LDLEILGLLANDFAVNLVVLDDSRVVCGLRLCMNFEFLEVFEIFDGKLSIFPRFPRFSRLLTLSLPSPIDLHRFWATFGRIERGFRAESRRDPREEVEEGQKAEEEPQTRQTGSFELERLKGFKRHSQK
jgi:hypothetical protein